MQNFDFSSIRQIAQNWFQMPQDTNGRIKLYEETEALIPFLHHKDLCSDLFAAFTANAASNGKLAEWIASNTRFQGEFSGAYKCFHDLFNAACKPEALKQIDEEAYKKIIEREGKSPQQLDKDIFNQISSQLSLGERVALRRTSQHDAALFAEHEAYL